MEASDLISEVRSALEDFGNTTTDEFTGDSTTTIWKLTSPPVKSNSETVTVNGVAQVKGVDYTINSDNGEVTFVSAPSAVAVSVRYTAVKWRTERILTGINNGIRRFFPRVYKIRELYVLLQPTIFEYDLTSTTYVPVASSFGDQTLPSEYDPAEARVDIVKAQTRIHFGHYRVYGSAQKFSPFEFFRRTTPYMLQVDRDSGANDTLRLTYTAPYSAFADENSSSEISDEFSEPLVWYALSTVLTKKEAPRVRADGYNVMQNVNAVPAGAQMRTGNDYLVLYKDWLRDSAMRPYPMAQRREARGWAR